MIVTENLTINQKHFVRTFSDSGMMILRDGVLYDEAYDLAELGCRYEESRIPMPSLRESEVLEILLGGAV